jgi:secreted trypsin-like serine protease
LLTAAHCVDAANHPDETFGVFMGSDATAFQSANTLEPKLVAVQAIHVHPDYDSKPPFHADIAIVELAAPTDVAPLPVQRTTIDAAIAAAPARIVGYGQTIYDQYNASKHSAATVVVGLDAAGDTLTVGDTSHRSCVGDSGGPALVVLGGAETIVGVDAYTDVAGCLEPAHYTRTDLYADFIATYAPPPAPTGTGGGGSSAGGAGGAATGKEPDDGGCAVSARSPLDGSPSWAMGVVIALVLQSRRRGRS